MGYAPGHQYLKGLLPTMTSCVASSNVAFIPVLEAAVVLIHAIEWPYPASTGLLGSFLLRTHSIQFLMWLDVRLSAPVLAEATTVSFTFVRSRVGSRLASMFIAFACRAESPPLGVTILVLRLSSPPFE